MNHDLGLSAARYGFASGVFFIGYILLEVPSDLALHKFEGEAKGKDAVQKHASVRTVLGNGRVWTLAPIYFGFVYGLYSLAFFLPTIIHGFETQYGTKFSLLQQGLVTAVPYFPAAAGIALINTAGNFAGFAAGYITGALKDWTGSYVVPMCLVGGLMLLSAVLMVGIST